MNILYEIYAFFLGAIAGSFSNACIYRLPKDLSIACTRSMCPRCGNVIRAWDNIPILSYFILRGKCRFCKTPYGIQYLVVEILLGLIALWIYRSLGFNFSSLYMLCLATSLVIVSVIDLHHRIIPNEISIGGTWVGLLIAGATTWLGISWWVTFKEALIGALIGYGFLWGVGFLYEKITGREGIGMGDMKLLALFGANTGLPGVLTAIFYGSLLGSISGMVLIFVHNKGRKYPIPFGPFLSIGFAIFLIWGTQALEVPLNWLFHLTF